MLWLASRSPRRRDLLTQAAVPFRALDVDIDECPHAGEPALTYVKRVAVEKAQAARPQIDATHRVLAADTTVELDGQILGKPVDDDDAVAMLRRLSGRMHRVYTAVCVADAERLEVAVSETRVSFQRLTEALVSHYVATGEPRGKAGAYAIQGAAARFVTRIEGSYSGVVGLPIHETLQLLAQFGCDPWGGADE